MWIFYGKLEIRISHLMMARHWYMTRLLAKSW
jgi:hypothetical protein